MVAVTKKAKSSGKIASQTKSGGSRTTAAAIGGRPRAVWKGLEEFNKLSRENQASALPFCVGENLTLKQFHAKCNRLESGGCFRWEFKDGKVWIYELPHAAHDRAAGELIREITRGLGQHFGDVMSAAGPRCDNNAANWSYEPDGSLCVADFRPGPNNDDRADAAGNRWPNIIVEVALNESEPHVRAKALNWLATAHKSQQRCPAGDCRQDWCFDSHGWPQNYEGMAV